MHLTNNQLKILKFFISTILLMISISPLADSLPVTSKPIENTPEHLAWEAWIMLPPSPKDRTRKITPKSIFILPNTSNGSDGDRYTPSGLFDSRLPNAQQQIQCPSGYRIDNHKCIPIITFDREQLVIQQLTGLFSPHGNDGDSTDANNNNVPSYEDYDYDNYDAPMNFDQPVGQPQIEFENSQKHSGGNSGEQPLKINLSLDKFPSGESLEKSEEMVQNLQPFRSPGIATTTTAVSPKEAEEEIIAAASTTSATTTTTTFSKSSTDETTTDRITTISTIDDSQNKKSSASITESIGNESTRKPFIIDMGLSDGERDSLESSTIAAVFVASPTSNSTDLDQTTTKTVTDDYDDDQTTVHLESNEDATTDLPETQKTIEDSLAEESFVFDKFLNLTSTTLALDQSTEELIETSTQTNIDEETTIQPAIEAFSQTLESYNQTDKLEIANEKNIESFMNIKEMDRGVQREKPIIELNQDVEPIMESIENNNRFVYHHLPSSNSPISSTQAQIPPAQSTSHQTAHDIQEQLRIINMIVEEKNRKESSKIRFPDQPEQRDGIRAADFIRFPEVTAATTLISSSPSHFSFQTNQFDPQKFLFHRRYFQPNSTPTTTTTTEKIAKQKPYWWLPSGWETDNQNSADRPLLIRFWSRMPVATTEQRTVTDDVTTTTSGYRENSRSPTDSLYREISAQEVYKVLGAARHWKHSSKR